MGILDKVVKNVGDAGSKVVDASSKVVKDVKKEGEKAVKTVKDTADDAADAAKKAANAVATGAGKVVSAGAAGVKSVGGGLKDAVIHAERLLTEKEKRLAKKVFADSLPYGDIYLSDGLGFGERQYTIPRPLHPGTYLIHIGPKIFPDATKSSVVDNGQTGDAIFIHELTHVWQSVHRKNPLDYIGDSLSNQLRYKADAYTYDSSKVGKAKWDSFNAEQQASIVEDWYVGGMKETSKAFVYIRDNIRKGKV